MLYRLPDEFGRMVASRMTEIDLLRHRWWDMEQNFYSAWPESPGRNQRLAGTANHTNSLASWQKDFPDYQPEILALLGFTLNAHGGLDGFTYTDAPSPADWITALTPEQRAAWAALEQADAANVPAPALASALDAFLQTQPDKAGMPAARFMQLRAEARTLSPTDAVEAWVKFARTHDNAEAASGLPLSNLALAEAIRRARETGVTEPLWTLLVSQASSRPSILIPFLMDDVEQLASTDPALREAMGHLRVLWRAQLAQRELAALVSEAGELKGHPTKNFWLDALGRRWFVIAQPTESRTYGPGRTATTNRLTMVRCYPSTIVGRGFAQALRDAKVNLPDYLELAIELEGEPVVLPARWATPQPSPDPIETLAASALFMHQPASLLGNDPFTGEASETPFESMPSRPQFILRVNLTDRPLLYAQVRQRQWIMGGMILCSVVAALAGLFATRRAFAKERALNEQKSNFVSSVSHELRAPIASVRLMAESLERGNVTDPGKQREYFRFIGQECRRLSALIANVLDFARIEQGRKQYELEPTDLGGLVEETVRLMQPYAAEREVRLKSEVRSPKSEVELDGRAIQQALVNLIDNAIIHSPAGETVTVALESGPTLNPQPSTLNISVTDHGPGIPATEIEKIFERFHRLGSELRRETQGVGIGLSIVKHIVEAHGARVLVESEIGKGSRFTIELPVKQTTNEHE
jgi:signal transduction histidine kinase